MPRPSIVIRHVLLGALISLQVALATEDAPSLTFDPALAAQQRGDAINDACIYGQGAAYNLAFGAALVGSFSGSVASYALNLGLKACAPDLDRPNDIRYNPGAGNCSVTVRQNRVFESRSNILGVPLSRDNSWGALGTPDTFHWNTGSWVNMNTFGSSITHTLDGDYTFPMGNNPVTWTAETLIAPIDFVFIYIPGLPKGVEKYLGGAAGREAAELILNVAIELGKFPLGTTLAEIFDTVPSGALRQDVQTVSVLDLVAPWFTTVGSTDFTFEAVDIGGTSFDSLNVDTNLSNGDVLRQGFTAHDNCDGEVELIAEKGFWPLNEISTHVWRALDNGPNLDDERNETTFTQTIDVVDTLPPIMVAPPDLAIEDTDSDGLVFMRRLTLGVPMIFDLGDPDIEVSVTGPRFIFQSQQELAEFDVGITEVVWTATDTSGNSTSVTQIVNAKTVGTNQPAFALPNQVDAQTFDFVTIDLQASDPDDDPLYFRIEQFPENGFFKAPLFPFFIEDYRFPKLSSESCLDRDPAEVVNPSYVTTTDEGFTYVLDHSTDQSCLDYQTDPRARHRIAKFDAEGNYLAGINLARKADLYGLKVHPERNEIVYTSYDPINQRRPIIQRHNADDLRPMKFYRTQATEWSSVNAGNISDDEVLYLSPGCDKVWVFDLNKAIPFAPVGFNYYLPGTAVNPGPCPTTAPDGFQLISLCPGNCPNDDSYVARDINFARNGDILISTATRLYRIEAPTRDDNGDLILSDNIFWRGRCTGGSGCNITTQSSFGFTCQDGVTCSGGSLFGEGQGQFYNLSGIDVDPNGNIYTAEWGRGGANGTKGRIQRFTDDGFFAGESKSSCPTDSRCFVLGDFSRPRAIAVNSDSLYVVDEDINVVHVFKTSVVDQGIADDVAQVTYASNEGFTGTDSFSFVARDGFPSSESDAATITVNVARNFRAPIAESVTLEATEDEVRSSILLATDPDGSLDTLSYTIVDPPQHGTIAFDGPVNGLGQPYTYTPDADYEGSDSFTFISNDGMEDSNLATVNINIAAVNDAPAISLRDVGIANRQAGNGQSVTIARGYETDFTFRIDEIDAVDLYLVSIDFGDGSPMAFEDDLSDGSIDGLALLPDAFGAEVVTQHAYSADADLNICVTDNVVIVFGEKLPTATSETVCETFSINTVPMADVQVELAGSPVVSLLQSTLTFELVLTNRAALDQSALNATNLAADLSLDERLTVIDWNNPAGGQCDLNNGQFACSLNTLAQGGEVRTRVTVGLPANRQVGDEYLIMTSASADQDDPLTPNMAALEFSVTSISDIVVNVIEDETTSCELLCGDSGLDCPGVGEFMPQCSLRSALQLANSLPGEQRIGLGNQTHRTDPDIGEWFLFDDVHLLGNGAQRTVLSGSNADRVLNVTNGVSATLEGLTVRDGNTTFSGGGIDVSFNASLELKDVWVTGNRALSGGGIRHRGELLKLDRVSVTGNQAINGDGITAAGGGLYLEGDSVFQNVTLSGNQSDGQSGGLHVTGSSTLALFNSTLTNNVSTIGAGGLVVGNGSTVNAYLNIISGNFLAADTGLVNNNCSVPGGANLISFGFNVVGLFCTNGQPADVVAENPMLKGLGFYGGSMPTHEPLVGSPAVDIGLDDCDADVDQRGSVRPVDGDMDGEVLCDSGAVEYLFVDGVFGDGFE